jgi:serine/threonine protein kinase
MEHSALTSVGDYTGLSEIGRGGSSVVYAAHAPDGAQVAIKVFNVGAGDMDTRRRLDREVTALEALRDIPGVLGVTDHLFTADGRPCLVMALMTGSLAHELAGGPLPVDRVLAIGEQVATSLDEVHRRGVHHRDLKPANLLVDADRGVWLADFGIAAVGGLELASQTIASLSPPYAPPERFVDTIENGSAAADVYSLAATIYALLAGSPPFGSSNQGGIAGLAMRVMSDPVPPIGREDLPDGLEAVLATAMAKRPLDRYATMADFGAALASVRLGEYIAPASTSSGPPVDADDDLTVRRDALAAGALVGSVTAATSAAPSDVPASESASSAAARSVVDEPGTTDPADLLPTHRGRVLVGAVVMASVLAAIGAAMLWFGGAPEESAQEVSVEGATTVAPRAADDADDAATADDAAAAATAGTVAPDASVLPEGSPTSVPLDVSAPGAVPTPAPGPAVSSSPSSPTPTSAPPGQSPVAAPTPIAPPATVQEPAPVPPAPVPPALPPPTVAPKVGDINGDGRVGCLDMRILLDDYGGTAARSDLNKDGTVGLVDLSRLLTNYDGDGTSWVDGTSKCPGGTGA